MPELAEGWEMVIGLEVHCELLTATKLFCSCRNAFGDDPNTNVCPVCLGLPGSLPVLNVRAVEFAMRIGAALHSVVKPSLFHRKNYFYPDMPKDYQVSQYDEPINVGGYLELPDGFRVGITRAHMEEDTGKSTHVGGTGRIHDATHSLVDYNRAGVPLVEIVSEPDIRTVDQAKGYVTELRAILVSSGASDGKMEEGSMRVDANVSVRHAGADALGTRCEIKNLNSVRSLGRAIEYEAARQIQLLGEGGRVAQETRHWDEGAGRTSTMRSKEEAYDYRYFPEPDLVPVVPSEAWVTEVRESLPVMPAERRGHLAAAVGVSPVDVATAVDKGFDPLVLAAVDGGAPGRIALNRAVNDLPEDATISVEAFTTLCRLEGEGKLTPTQAKQILADLLDAGGDGDPVALAANRGYETFDDDAVAAALDAVIAANPAQWERMLAGDAKVVGFFVGQVMRATGGKANGAVVTAILRRTAELARPGLSE